MVEREKAEGGEFGEIHAYLGKGSRVSGKLNFEGTVRVDGQVEGEISAQDTLIVGERAVVTAQINGNTVVIRGKVTGDINARKRVEIRAPGKLFGNIVTPSLVIHEGVIFEGHCSMGGGTRISRWRIQDHTSRQGRERRQRRPRSHLERSDEVAPASPVISTEPLASEPRVPRRRHAGRVCDDRPREERQRPMEFSLETIVYQAALFVALYFVLKKLVFERFLANLDARQDRTRGALEQATRLREEAARLQADYESQMARAASARRPRSGKRSAGRRKSEERELVESARQEAARALMEARVKIAAEAEATRAALAGEIAPLSRRSSRTSSGDGHEAKTHPPPRFALDRNGSACRRPCPRRRSARRARGTVADD